MLAEIISIGDELTSGQRLDTNSQWLSQRLGEIGIAVIAHATVADDLERNVEIFRQAVERADVIVATGGLGPTADDLTRDVLARVADVELVMDGASLEHIRALFARRQRPMPERNTVQAMFPAGARAISNPQGTAPGIAMTVSRRSSPGASRVYALPGVPAEMYEMWKGTVEPELLALEGRAGVIVHRQIRCFGVGESDLEQMLPDLIRRGRTPTVGITVSDATITLRISAAGATAEECQAQIEPTVDTIRQCLGQLVFGEGEDELEDAVARLLRGTECTVASCEWGTAGLLASWLGKAGQGDASYLGGTVVTGTSAATRLLGGRGLEVGHGNNAATARALATACRESFAADYGLAVSAFPPADTDDEARKVYFALTTPDGRVVERSQRFLGHSALLKQRAAKQALDVLRLELLKGCGT